MITQQKKMVTTQQISTTSAIYIEPIFLEYISLNEELESEGGRIAINENPSLEPLYDKIYDIENEILKSFGLPSLIKFRAIIFDLTSEIKINKIIRQLKNAAEYYLKSAPKNAIELLEDAKMNDLKTYDILPEIGIDDDQNAMFYFEQYFKKGKIDAKELIYILKSFDKGGKKK